MTNRRICAVCWDPLPPRAKKYCPPCAVTARLRINHRAHKKHYKTHKQWWVNYRAAHRTEIAARKHAYYKTHKEQWWTVPQGAGTETR